MTREEGGRRRDDFDRVLFILLPSYFLLSK
jgi:hypothetical protein